MQDRPTAAELLRDIADLLEGDVLAALSGPLQHNVRVAGNLARIVQRELELGPAADAREHALLSKLVSFHEEKLNETTQELNAAVAKRIRAGDGEFAKQAFPAVLEIVRGKVAIVKPGHDDYDFADE